MRYQEVLTYMYNSLPMFHRQGKAAFKKDLTNVRLLCEALGNPQNRLKCIHIAGTNGKGSVSHMMASVLQAHGYSVGLYISPHYVDFRERIKCNGSYIPKGFVKKFVVDHLELFESVKPSFFEMTVAMAFQYLADQRVDFAVIETGLGGRLDSTNIIKPILSIITNISFDHMDMLGDSLSAIAAEKAGIIKSGVPVVIGRKQEETTSVFEISAEKLQSPVYYTSEIIRHYHATTNERGIASVHCTFGDEDLIVHPDLKGLYQVENIRTVLAACSILQKYGHLTVDPRKLEHALEHVQASTSMVGRWQWLSTNPPVVCESAHNEDGIRYLIKQLQSLPFEQLHIVCGFVKDKDLEQVLSQMPRHAVYYFVHARIPRAKPAAELQMTAENYQLLGHAYKSVRTGLAAAMKAAGPEDLIVVTGSIFVVAEVLEMEQKKNKFLSERSTS